MSWPVYLLTPFLAWLVAGSVKFLINSLRKGGLATAEIGYGGMPSNHSTIVSSMAALIGFREGMDSPAFGVAVALAFIVMLDAGSLRRQIGQQARAINRLGAGDSGSDPLRERLGHRPAEILAGVFLGILVGFVVYRVSA